MSNEINSPFSPAPLDFTEPVMSKAPPLELTEQAFTDQSLQILNEGVENHYSKEYVTDQLFHLAYKNQNTAKELGFPMDHPTIKNQVVEKWYNGRPSNGPDPKAGPEGEFEIIVHDAGGRDGPTYGGTLTVRKNDGKEAVTVPASSWPNPANGNPGIAEGTYSAVYRNNGHHQIKPGVRLRDGGKIPTLGPNPAQEGQPYSKTINAHCGDKPEWRGSAGCVTVVPDSCDDAWNVLDHDTSGTVTVER